MCGGVPGAGAVKTPRGCDVTAVARWGCDGHPGASRKEDTREERNPPGAGFWAGIGPGPPPEVLTKPTSSKQPQLPLQRPPARPSQRGPFKNHVNKALFPRLPLPSRSPGPLLLPTPRVSGPLTLPAPLRRPNGAAHSPTAAPAAGACAAEQRYAVSVARRAPSAQAQRRRRRRRQRPRPRCALGGRGGRRGA